MHDPRRTPWGERALLVGFVAGACWILVDSDRVASVRDGAMRLCAALSPARSVEAEPSELARLTAENRVLQEALVALGDQLIKTQALLRDARCVESLFAPGDGYRLIPARVIARSDPRESRRVIVLARGAADGVSPGMPAVSGASLIGKVDTVTRATCRVVLVTDPACRVRVALAEEGRPPRAGGACKGVLSGIELRFVAVEGAPRVGTLVVTAGAAARIPPGLIIGRVAAVDRSGDRYEAGVEVQPMKDAFELDMVQLLDLGVAALAEMGAPPPADAPGGR